MDMDTLIEKYLDGSISPSERAELFTALKKDKGLLKDFVMDVHLDNALESFFSEKDSSDTIQFPPPSNVIELSDDDLKDIAAAGNPQEYNPADDDKNI